MASWNVCLNLYFSFIYSDNIDVQLVVMLFVFHKKRETSVSNIVLGSTIELDIYCITYE